MTQERENKRHEERSIRKPTGPHPDTAGTRPRPLAENPGTAEADEREREEEGPDWRPEGEAAEYDVDPRHARGFTSAQAFDSRYGRTLGEGAWRSADDQGEDRSGRAGFGWEDLEPDVEEVQELSESEMEEVVSSDEEAGPILPGTPPWVEDQEFRPDVAREDDVERWPAGEGVDDDEDNHIREAILDALARETRLDTSDVEIDVLDGEVILRGHVPDEATLREVQTVATSVVDIRHVSNLLRIPPTHAPTDHDHHRPR